MELKRLLTGFIAFCCCSCFLCAELDDLQLESEAVIVMNGHTGKVLFEKNGYAQYYPASITKIATAWHALNKKQDFLKTMITASQDAIGAISSEKKKKSNYAFPPHWLEFGSSHIGIKKNEKLSFETLLYGMMLSSGNDAANVIAEFVSGSVAAFTVEVNDAVKQLGCRQTHFVNPHGLHHPDHLTTAYDMALIAKEALNNPLFRTIVSTVKFMRPRTNLQPPAPLVLGNRLLRPGPSYYPHAIGVKTGFTEDARNTFVAAAEYQGRLVIVVLLKSEEIRDKYEDAKKIFDFLFQEKQQQYTLLSDQKLFSLPLSHASSALSAHPQHGVLKVAYPSEKPVWKAFLSWDQTLELPIQRGQRVGEIRLHTGQEEEVIPLIAGNDVEKKLWFRFLSWMHQWRIVAMSIIGAGLMVLGGFVLWIVRAKSPK